MAYELRTNGSNFYTYRASFPTLTEGSNRLGPRPTEQRATKRKGLRYLGAVEGADDQVDDGQVEELGLRVLQTLNEDRFMIKIVFKKYIFGERGHYLSFLFFFKFSQQLLSLLVLRSDQIADAEVGQHHGADVEDAVVVLLDQRLVERRRLAELVVLRRWMPCIFRFWFRLPVFMSDVEVKWPDLHEERVGHVETPDVGVAAELG